MTTAGTASSAVSNNCPDQIRRSRESGNTYVIQYTSGSSEAAGVRWEFWKSSQIHYSVQAIYMYEDKADSSRRIDLMSTVVHTGRISRYLEGEYVRGSEERTIRI